MEMQDPSLTPGGEAKDSTLNAAAAEVVAENTMAPALDNVNDEAEAEIEDIVAEAEKGAHTAESLIAAAKALAEKDGADINTAEIRRLRQLFAQLRSAAAPVAAEGEEAPAADPVQTALDEEFAAAIEAARARKAEWVAQQEAMRAENLARKNLLIAQIIALAEDTDNVNRTFAQYRDLQDAFNATGDVDPAEETAVWKRFQEAREKYSDNLKINKELRDYDFKKNLTEKQAMLASAEELLKMDDVVEAYRQLQELHIRWRQVGPVAKELRDEIWTRFRELTADINKRYQTFFEARKARETENELAKTALCNQIEALDYSSLKTFGAWEEMTQTIMQIQEEWRKLGFAAKRVNRSLFARFRRSCDAFFNAKAEFYRSIREELGNNLARKQQLVQEVEALKESTDWRATADRITAMQKEWKTIGAVPKRYSDEVWKQFTAACNYFFDRRKKALSATHAAENANLKTKRAIVAEINALVEADMAKNEVSAALQALQKRWQETGYVPMREKDALREAYQKAVDAVRNRFAIAESRARRERFEASVASIEGDSDKLFREREKMMRALEGRRNDLRTYENNLGFLSSKSKSGDSLVRDMERRIERLKAEISEIEQKIALIDSKL